MKFNLDKLKVNINEIELNGQSLVGVNALFFPYDSGNYFSVKYKDKICNIINMNSENFLEIKRKQQIKKINLVEIYNENNVSTGAFLLHSKKLTPDWYLENLYFYNTNLITNDEVDEKKELKKFLLEKKYAINFLKSIKEETKPEDIENIILKRYKNFEHKFNYIYEEDKNMLELRESVKIDNGRNFNKDQKYYIDIATSVMYQFNFTDYGNLYMYSHKKEDYINNYIIGYSILGENKKSFEHCIIVNEKLINFINEIKKFGTFKNKCENLSLNGKFKFYNLLDKEKKEEYNQSLKGSGIDKKNSNVYLKHILDRLENKEYFEYNSNNVFDLNLNFLVEELKNKQLLKSDNEKYSNEKSTKTRFVCIYYYELIIQEEVNDEEFIARLSYNNRSFYYLRFKKENNSWDYTPVKQQTEVVVTYV